MKKKNPKLTALTKSISPRKSYNQFLGTVIFLLEESRRASAKVVNSILSSTYWEIGRRIVHVEQQGKLRATYGDSLIENLSIDLTKRFGRGFSLQNLQQMRVFYLTYHDAICHTK